MQIIFGSSNLNKSCNLGALRIKETRPLLHLLLRQHLEHDPIVLKTRRLIRVEEHHLHLLHLADLKQMFLVNQHHQESLPQPEGLLLQDLQLHRHSQMLASSRIPIIKHLLEHMLPLIQDHLHHPGLQKHLSRTTNQEIQVQDLEFLLHLLEQEQRHHPLHHKEAPSHLHLLETYINQAVPMLYRLHIFLHRLYHLKLQHLRVRLLYPLLPLAL